ncbi:hypothetical protein CULT_170050 [[Clostridium] ultunense Esp]|nr:hypothetical protein CULT_170050 [[Clostridium] ultunense Esp]
MKKGKGIVLKLEQDGMILLGQDGGFYRRPLPHPLPLLGEELEYEIEEELAPSNEGIAGKKGFPGIQRFPLRRLAVAALILLIIAGSILIRPITPEAAYVVALDINPNLELYVDRQDRVQKVIAYDEETNRFLEGLLLKGANITEAVGEITARAKDKGYLQKPDAWVVATVVPLKSEVKKEEILAKIGEVLTAGEEKGKVILTSADPKNLDEAHKKNLPVYKYAVLQYLEKSGSKISEKEKKTPTVQLMEEFKINLNDILNDGEILRQEPQKGDNGKGKKDENTKDQGAKGIDGVKGAEGEKKGQKKDDAGKNASGRTGEGIKQSGEIKQVGEKTGGKETNESGNNESGNKESGNKEGSGKKNEGGKDVKAEHEKKKGGEKEKGNEENQGDGKR